MFNLIPKEPAFFDLFEKASANALECSRELVEFLEHFDDLPARARRIKELEHVGDELTHETIERLNKTFITPIDREDIHELVCRIDDILDLAEEAVDRIVLFKVTEPLPESRELARCIVRQVELLCEMIPILRNIKSADLVRQKVREVHRLESEADRIEHQALVTLFDGSFDPLTVIKWKSIIEFLEAATDRCEDVANVVEGIVLKNV
jgi:uncharacterized protein